MDAAVALNIQTHPNAIYFRIQTHPNAILTSLQIQINLGSLPHRALGVPSARIAALARSSVARRFVSAAQAVDGRADDAGAAQM